MAMMSKDSEKEVQRDLKQALEVAGKAWREAGMASVSQNAYDPSKVAIALLACKVLDIYGNNSR